MGLEAEWLDQEFSDFVPAIINDPLFEAALTAAEFYAQFQREAQKARGLILEGDVNTDINIALEGLNVFIELLRKTINDVINTGVFLLIIPPGQGGLARMRNFVRTALLNVRDPKRPTFSDEAFIWATGGLAFGFDVPRAQEAFTVITKVITSNVKMKRAALAERLETLGGVAPSYYKNQLAGDAGPIEKSPWQRARLSDLTPGLNEVLVKASSYLLTVQNSATVSTKDSFLDFANQQYSLTVGLIEEITNAISFLVNTLEKFPILVFGAKTPVVGGLNELISAVDRDFYNVDLHPELEPVTDISLTTGYFIVGGAPSLEAATAEYETVKGIYNLT